jgi:Mrp family chromosome partitioning ATPase
MASTDRQMTDQSIATGKTPTAGPPAPGSLLDTLVGRQLLVVTGKGGVGKSVVSGALARLAAGAGRRVLLLEADPRETQHELAGVAPSGGEYVVAGVGLLLQNLRPRRVFEAAVREHVHVDFLVHRIVQSPLFQHFVDAAPGMKELAVLGHALRVLRGLEPTPFARVDLVVLDAPATGHGVSMLAAPRVVSEVVEGGPFAYLAHELATFIDDAAATGLVVVTLAEDMPVQEALELRASLATRVRRTPDVLVVNGVYPPAAEHAARDEGTGAPLTGAFGLWRRRRAINDRELARLDRDWPGPRVVLPLVPLYRGPALLREIVRRLDHGLREAPPGVVE